MARRESTHTATTDDGIQITVVTIHNRDTCRRTHITAEVADSETRQSITVCARPWGLLGCILRLPYIPDEAYAAKVNKAIYEALRDVRTRCGEWRHDQAMAAAAVEVVAGLAVRGRAGADASVWSAHLIDEAGESDG